jgi:hypothetical protein
MRERVPPFTGSQATLLAHFLSSPKRPKDTLSYPQLAGFLFSLGNGPELIPPSEWIPLVFNLKTAVHVSGRHRFSGRARLEGLQLGT